MGLTQPSAQQDWMDTAWTLHDTVNTLALATVNFPTAKIILYTTFSLEQLQAEMEQQKVTGLAVSHFIVVKVRLLSLLCCEGETIVIYTASYIFPKRTQM